MAGGTTAGVLEGQSLGTAFNNSLNGLGGSMAMGGAIGIASTIGVSYANKVNPWTGKDLNLNSDKISLGTRNPLNSESNSYNGRTVTNPAGDQVTLDIPSDYIMRSADNGNGVVYQAPGSTGNANMIRIMGPTDYAPNGYTVFYNKYGQPFNPNTGHTLSRSLWHFKF